MIILSRLYSLMNSKSIKINYFLNFLRVVSGALVGILLLPYIVRILGPEHFGKVEYIYTIINYFVLFSALGIPMYGIREVSKHRNDKRSEAKIVSELLIILLATSFISYIIIFGFLFQLNYFTEYKSLLIVFSAMIFLTNIGAEWYFQGTENQLFITIRYLIVRILAIFFVFAFIQNSDDYLFYAGFIVLVFCGANIINIYYIIKIIKPYKFQWNELELKKHMKPIITIFTATIAVNIYLQLDNLLIGAISGDKYVGYYGIANKLIRFVISFITIFGAVMLPKLSLLFSKDQEAYNNYLKESFNFLLFMSVPFAVYFYTFSDSIIMLISGKEFLAASLTMKILSPLCIVVSLAYFMGFLVLYPRNKENYYTIATVISAIFSICLNYFAIKKFQQNGAAVVAVLSEILAIIIMLHLILKNRYLNFHIDKNVLLIFLSGVFCLLFGMYFRNYAEKSIMIFIILSILMFLFYFIITFLLKERISLNLFNILKKYCNV